MRRLLLGLLMLLTALGSAGAQVTVERVRPGKILYDFGETATADITLKNAGAAAVSGTLTVKEEWDLTESRLVWTGQVTVPPGESKAFPVTWKIVPPMFGRALRASFTPEGKPVASGAEFFQVADPASWLRCFLLNTGGDQDVEAAKTDPFVTYGNYSNHFAYAESDFGSMAPNVDTWYSGQANYPMSKQALLAQIEGYKRFGIRAGAYTNPFLGGAFAYEFARQHPEWVVHTRSGAFQRSSLYPFPLDPLDLTLPPSKKRKGWYLLYPDLANPQVLKFGIDDCLRSIDMFGWDAIYVDGTYCVADACEKEPTYLWNGQPALRGETADQQSAKCAAALRDALRKAHPHIAIWYNGAALSPGDHMRETKLASLRDSNCGTLFEIQGAQINNPNFFGHNWRAYYEGLLSRRAALRRMPGVDNPPLMVGYTYNMFTWSTMTKEEYAASRDLWTTSNTLGALLMAAGGHPCWCCSSGFRAAAQFMTRYSAFLWAQDLTPIKEPWKRMAVNSNREVWWEDAVYTREDKAYRDTIIHVVNTPDEEEVNFRVARDPTPARRVEVEFPTTVPAARVQVWAMSPYEYDAADKQPTQMQLKPQFAGGKLFVELPPVTYYTLLVIRERKG